MGLITVIPAIWLWWWRWVAGAREVSQVSPWKNESCWDALKYLRLRQLEAETFQCVSLNAFCGRNWSTPLAYHRTSSNSRAQLGTCMIKLDCFMASLWPHSTYHNDIIWYPLNLRAITQQNLQPSCPSLLAIVVLATRTAQHKGPNAAPQKHLFSNKITDGQISSNCRDSERDTGNPCKTSASVPSFGKIVRVVVTWSEIKAERLTTAGLTENCKLQIGGWVHDKWGYP